ncbi:MAG: hypothetical protein ACOYJQ_03775 [Pseudochelatococcus sp.]
MAEAANARKPGVNDLLVEIQAESPARRRVTASPGLTQGLPGEGDENRDIHRALLEAPSSEADAVPGEENASNQKHGRCLRFSETWASSASDTKPAVGKMP